MRDARFQTDQPAREVLYVQSPAAVSRLALSYDALASDIYWIRAIQHFGRTRLNKDDASDDYTLLFPLLDLCTSLDPYFNIAYRFGAIFLSEPPPGGPGQPELAIRLLQKGLVARPTKWEYLQDIGFVHYWFRQDYKAAAEWFDRAAKVPNAPWWLKPLAAHTLASGGDRQSSRMLYRALAQSDENEFMKKDAQRRLRQLDALDQVDQLNRIVSTVKEKGAVAPFTWERFIRSHILRRVPTDPDGFPYRLDEQTGSVTVNPASSLNPLPTEPQRASGTPPA